MRVLISVGAIGPALSAVEATRALAGAWVAAGHEVLERPMSDGDEELVESVRSARGGELVPVLVRPVDIPGGDPGRVPAALLHVPGRSGGTAFAETSVALGGGSVGSDAGVLLRTGTTAPVADLVMAALQTGASRIVIGLGPTAVHDGGLGFLRRLAELLGFDDALASLPRLRERLGDVQLDVAAATDLPLLGLHGAGAALSSRPGISPAQAQEAERAVGEIAERILAAADEGGGPAGAGSGLQLRSRPRPVVRPTRDQGTGAGGGSAFALAVLGARLLPGAEVVAAETGVVELSGEVDLVLTGCTTLDGTAMHTGVVAAVGRAAMAHGVPVVAVGQDVQVSRRDGARVGVSATYPVRDPRTPGLAHQDPPAAADPWDDMVRRAERIRRTWAP
ncbi:glycerate kinase [Ruania suaedae]|uniref:glycerate kinase n=1 Tax=Ruania suaedae TaxID=2897774 RepID=UPI001E601AEE|nr:glycerate kinase [Ruania suaedae]UFU01649.1 glycerate kinase [Ruania suaedae]